MTDLRSPFPAGNGFREFGGPRLCRYRRRRPERSAGQCACSLCLANCNFARHRACNNVTCPCCMLFISKALLILARDKLREAFPFDSAPRFLIFDRDAKYGLEVSAAVRFLKINPVQTSFESPWQSGIAERWVGSCRRDLLDHIIPIDERHLRRLLSEYIRYHHEDRTHLGLGKGTPNGRSRTIASGRVLSHERLGGLHHRYDRAA
jgi:Integrase core domain